MNAELIFVGCLTKLEKTLRFSSILTTTAMIIIGVDLFFKGIFPRRKLSTIEDVFCKIYFRLRLNL